MIDFVNYKIMRKNIFGDIFNKKYIVNKTIDLENLFIILYF
jgi:hypothetical protein